MQNNKIKIKILTEENCFKQTKINKLKDKLTISKQSYNSELNKDEKIQLLKSKVKKLKNEKS